MASIFDLFKQTQPAPQVTNSANANTTVPGTANIPGAREDLSNAGATGTPASPLDNYKDLWKTDPNAKPEEPFRFNSDPAQLMETAKQVDFTKMMTPDLQKRIAAGGQDAQQATLELMSSMNQMSFAQSAHAASKITEAALQEQEKRFMEKLPQLVKQFAVNDSLRQDNPLLTDPAMAPMIHALQHQFTKQYPNATAVEIKDHVNNYLNGAADKITSLRPQPKSADSRKEQDWSRYLPE